MRTLAPALRGDVITGGAVTLIGVVYYIATFWIQETKDIVTPRTFPAIVGIALIVLGLFLAGQALYRSRKLAEGPLGPVTGAAPVPDMPALTGVVIDAPEDPNSKKVVIQFALFFVYLGDPHPGRLLGLHGGVPDDDDQHLCPAQVAAQYHLLGGLRRRHLRRLRLRVGRVPARRNPGLGGGHGHTHRSGRRLRLGARTPESGVRAPRRAAGHRRRRAAGNRPDLCNRDPHPRLLRDGAGARTDPALRHLLRFHVRRVDHRHTHQNPR